MSTTFNVEDVKQYKEEDLESYSTDIKEKTNDLRQRILNKKGFVNRVSR